MVVVNLPAARGCPLLPWPLSPGSAVPGEAGDAGYFAGGTILLVAAMVDDCAFVADQMGRSDWVLSQGLRHLGAAPGNADTLSAYLFPFLPHVV